MYLIERKLNYKESFEVKVEEMVAQNYYPINSWIALFNFQPDALHAKPKDDIQSIALINDRSQGGSSIHVGELEVMI